MSHSYFTRGLLVLMSCAAALEARAQQPAQPNVIYLNAGNIDTAAPQAQARSKTVSAAGKQLRLIQFDGPIQPEWVTDLENSGLRIVDYVPENAYLVYGDVPAVQTMQAKAVAKSHVRWEGAYRGVDKIHPVAAQSAAAQPSKARPDPTLFSIQLILDPTANPSTLALIDSLKLKPVIRQGPSDKYYNIVVSLPPGSIGQISDQPDVISILPYNTPGKRDEKQCIIMTGQLSGNVPTGPGYMTWLANRGFTQAQFDSSGLVVDVTDSPIDNGATTAVNHFALYKDGTISNSSPSRVVYNRLEGTANTGSITQAQDGHGNLNAHIIGGQVNLTNAPHADSGGYRYGLGVAPFVKVGGSIIFDTSSFTSPNYDNLAARAYRDGARVSGNSWGADTAGAYDSDAQNYDRLVRDAQPSGSAVATTGNQQMSFVFAAGNAGSGTQTVGSPGTAKNVITVGAAENVRAFGGSDGSGIADTGADSANDVISFSSRGPCSDQRKKPDIMAPGTHITGGAPQNVKTMTGTGTALTRFDGSGVSGGITNSMFFPSSGQQFYTASSGTSHSTPAVAGAAALVYQWFINKGWATATNPASPAMIKAYLMNAARYMTGVSANDALYSNNQGMGMVNLDASFDDTVRLLRDQLAADIFTASGQSRSWTGQISTGSKPLRITLAWTDAPGSTTGNAYKNNLDLTVTVNGTVYRGNNFSGANSVAGGTADVRNNVESVFIPAGTTGNVSITVAGTNINSDGVPNFGTTVDQDFALVAYNFTEVQAPAIVGAGFTLVAEEPDSVNNAIDPAEFVSVGFGLRNAGNLGTANLTATLLQTNGIIPVTSAPVSYGALAAGGAAVTNNFEFVANADCGSMVTAVLALQDGSTNLGTASFNFVLGTFSSTTATNTNSAAITIRDNNSATPYPSTINVAGRTGTVSKVTVTIPAFSHTYPDDVNMILVAPDGKKVALMGGVGAGTDAVNVALTFDDAAAGPIGASVVAGAYQPSGSVSSMPTGAPTGPYASTLSEFNGSPANGAWSLYVADAAAIDSGIMAQGWRIVITTSQASCLGVNQEPVVSLTSPANGSTVRAGQTVNLAATASDLAADGSPGVISKVEFFEGTNWIATDTTAPYGATWTPPAAGFYTLSARATDSENLAGNSESVTLGVLSGDGSPTISSFTPTSGASLSPVVIGGNNFAGVTSVLFNGVNAGNFTVDSLSQITAVVPAAATTGPISVVNSFGTATSTGVFTVLQTPVLISQIYGGGGNSGAKYRNDYVELYNRSSVSVDVSGWTIQYASATGTNWQTAALTGSIASGKYYLVQLASGSSGAVLPTADATGTIAMSATAGKVALRSSATAFTGGTPVGQAGLEDFVGFGTSASAFEGAGAAPAPSATTSIFRGGGGETDTGNNNNDFTSAAPNPRNSGSVPVLAPVITSALSKSGVAGTSLTYQITASNSPTSYGASNLPANLTVNTNTGAISGVPQAAGTNNVTIFASNAGGTGSATLVLTVTNPPVPVITSTNAVNGVVGTNFSYQITASNNPTRFGASNLPANLTVNTNTGLISGIPQAAGTNNVTIFASNAGGASSAQLAITVRVPAPVITSTNVANGIVGMAFNYQIIASNNPTSFGASNLPTGLTVNTNTGEISGTPSAAGISTATITASNAGGTGLKSLVITVTPVNTSSLVAGWDFQTTSNGGTAAAGAPSSPTVYVANFGSGTIFLNGSNGSSIWATNTSGNELTAFAGTTNNAAAGFSTNTTSPAALAVVSGTGQSANGKRMVFRFNMAGRTNLSITYAVQRTTAGFSTNSWDWSTNGTNWTSIGAITSIPSSFGVVGLSNIFSLDGVTNSFLRVTFNGATDTSGNNRLDNIQLVAPLATSSVQAVGSVSSLSTTYGTASTPGSFNISGANLTEGITVTPPSGFEVSKTVGGASGYSSNQIVGAAGTVASTTIYVRLASATAAGSYSGDILLNSAGSAGATVAIPSSIVAKKDASITGIAALDKVYDATTSASIAGTPAYGGLVNGESFAVTGSATALFASASAGVGKSVTVTGFNAPSANYNLLPLALSASISSKELTIVGLNAVAKIYDGTTSASLGGTPELSGLEAVDAGNVSLGGTPSAEFDAAGVGVGVGVMVSGYTLTGTGAANYNVAQPSGLTADITQRSATVRASNRKKPFGTPLTLGPNQTTGFTVSGIASGEKVDKVTLTVTSGGGTNDSVGNYADAITPSDAAAAISIPPNPFRAENYSITYVAGSLSVTESGSPSFGDWAGQKGLTGADALPSSDPDNDGIANLLEYYMGLEPLLADSNTVSVGWNPGNPASVSMSYRRAKNTTGVTGGVIWNSALNSSVWSNNGVTENATDGGTYENVTATVTNAPGETRKFLRLEVQQQ